MTFLVAAISTSPAVLVRYSVAQGFRDQSHFRSDEIHPLPLPARKADAITSNLRPTACEDLLLHRNMTRETKRVWLCARRRLHDSDLDSPFNSENSIMSGGKRVDGAPIAYCQCQNSDPQQRYMSVVPYHPHFQTRPSSYSSPHCLGSSITSHAHRASILVHPSQRSTSWVTTSPIYPGSMYAPPIV